MKIAVDLTRSQVKGLRDFAKDWAAWHLDDRKMSLESALLVCVLYTAVGPVNTNEVGSSGASAAEIDDDDLISAVNEFMAKESKKGGKR